MFSNSSSVQCAVRSPCLGLGRKSMTPVTCLTSSLNKTNLLSSAPKRLLCDAEPDNRVRKLAKLDFFGRLERSQISDYQQGFTIRECDTTKLFSNIDNQENLGYTRFFCTPEQKSNQLSVPVSFRSCNEKGYGQRKPMADISNRRSRKSLIFSSPAPQLFSEDTSQCMGTALERAPTVELNPVTVEADSGVTSLARAANNEIDPNSMDSGFGDCEKNCDSRSDEETSDVAPVPFSLDDLDKTNDCDSDFSVISPEKSGTYSCSKFLYSSSSSTNAVQVQKISSSTKRKQQSSKVSRRLLTNFGDIASSSDSDEDSLLYDLCSKIDNKSEASDQGMEALFSRPVNAICKAPSVKLERESSKTGPLLPCDDPKQRTVVSSTGLLRAKSTVLASDVDFSPCGVSNHRKILRRTISLMDANSSEECVSTTAALNFKRPLPPSESPYAQQKKKLKYMALASTPTFSTVAKKHHAGSPIGLNFSDSSCDEDNDSFLRIPPLGGKRSLAGSDHLTNSVEASPDFFRPVLQRAQSTIGVVARKDPLPSPPAVPTFSSKPILHRSMSETQVTVMKALSKSHESNEKLTGDFKNPVSLPVLGFGRHPELPSITPETMKDLLNGGFSDLVESYEILDCRYPYEYEGGHILGAQNWHNVKFVMDRINEVAKCVPQPANPSKRRILIFHCEFSAERAPRNQRLLRQEDRSLNSENYPALHFPELYLLEGGYKAFFEKFPEYCTPMKYTRMADPMFGEQMRMCRARGNSCVQENKLVKSKSGYFGRRTAVRRL